MNSDRTFYLSPSGGQGEREILEKGANKRVKRMPRWRRGIPLRVRGHNGNSWKELTGAKDAGV